MALQRAINIVDDILSKVDEFGKQATPVPAAAEASEPAAQATKKGKKDKKATKKEASAAPDAAATGNEQSSDPFSMADLRVSARFLSRPFMELYSQCQTVYHLR